MDCWTVAGLMAASGVPIRHRYLPANGLRMHRCRQEAAVTDDLTWCSWTFVPESHLELPVEPPGHDILLCLDLGAPPIHLPTGLGVH